MHKQSKVRINLADLKVKSFETTPGVAKNEGTVRGLICTDCTDSSNDTGCTNCTNHSGCTDCSGCTGCTDCTYDTACSACTNTMCSDCSGGSDSCVLFGCTGPTVGCSPITF